MLKDSDLTQHLYDIDFWGIECNVNGYACEERMTNKLEEKLIYLNKVVVERLIEVISNYPGLSLNMIIN